MKNLFLIIAFLITYSLALANDENAIFDTNRTDPQTLLHHEYQKSKILFLGFAYHANNKHIDQLRELLKQIGNDPNLKTIILERAGDTSEFSIFLSIS
jgi:thymidylate synthase